MRGKKANLQAGLRRALRHWNFRLAEMTFTGKRRKGGNFLPDTGKGPARSLNLQALVGGSECRDRVYAADVLREARPAGLCIAELDNLF